MRIEQRKVIGTGKNQSNKLITLSKEWCDSKGIEKGDFLTTISTDKAFIIIKEPELASRFITLLETDIV